MYVPIPLTQHMELHRWMKQFIKSAFCISMLGIICRKTLRWPHAKCKHKHAGYQNLLRVHHAKGYSKHWAPPFYSQNIFLIFAFLKKKYSPGEAHEGLQGFGYPASVSHRWRCATALCFLRHKLRKRHFPAHRHDVPRWQHCMCVLNRCAAHMQAAAFV